MCATWRDSGHTFFTRVDRGAVPWEVTEQLEPDDARKDMLATGELEPPQPGVGDDRDPTADDPDDRAVRGRAYRADGITVYFNARKCWHTGICLRGLPLVFDVGRRPWVRADLDTPEKIAAQIDLCPSGALSYDLIEGEGGSLP